MIIKKGKSPENVLAKRKKICLQKKNNPLKFVKIVKK